MKRFLLVLILLPLLLSAVGWPVGDINKPRPVGNSWGELQSYGSSPNISLYLHPGVDVMGVTVGQPVHAVASGQVKSWLTIGGEIYWRLAIADSATNDSCNGWLYAHIDPNRAHKAAGDMVKEGDLIGYLVPWAVPGFDHLHWARIRSAGVTWSSDWLFVDNPSVELDSTGDVVSPIFENASGNHLFAFRPNNSSPNVTYFSPDSISGDVDIIARIHDKTGVNWANVSDTVWERLAPLEVWFEIHGAKSTKPVRSFIFDGLLQWDDNEDVIYSRDSTCFSIANYKKRDYYFILTNTDGDSLRESSDKDSAWHTADFPDGSYWVVVTAKDAGGNVSVDSMRVNLKNGVGIHEEDISRLSTFTILTSLVSRGAELSLISPVDCILKIYDASGRLSKTVSVSSSPVAQKITLKGLSAGVYFISSSSASSAVNKIVITR